MGCSNGRVNISPNTKLKLFAHSGGFCQNPDCNENLFLTIKDSDFHIAEMAHIISAGNSGARADKTVNSNDKAEFDNLILLCPNCHTKIDKADDAFPKELILKWKKDHIDKINSLFKIQKFKTRIEVKERIKPLLDENKTIFNIYGPMTEHRFNPESEIPKLWLSKVHQNIMPNNRKILSILEVNYNLLNDQEIVTFGIFKQHVLDFEEKHINKTEINATLFPILINNILED